MTATGSIFLVADPVGEQWNVGRGENGCYWLIGWQSEGVDSGVPGAVMNVLSRALVGAGLVTFLTSASDIAAGDACREVQANGLSRWMPRKDTQLPPRVALVSSSSDTTIRRLFDDAEYPWWMQGQIVLLSDPGSEPPSLTHGDLAQIMEPTHPMTGDLLSKLHIAALLRPGVDGDVAALYAQNRQTGPQIVSALERAAEVEHIDVRTVSEAEFLHMIAANR
jgi:hypothetical protein